VSAVALTALVTDKDLNVLGDPIPWTAIEGRQDRNAPGAYSLTSPASGALHERIAGPGNRILLLRSGEVWCAGPIEYPDEYDWSADDSSAAGPGESTVRWTDDLALICARNTYPNAALAATAQVTAKRSWTATNGETILRALVNENAGPGALTARRIPKLALGTSAGVGSAIDFSSRFGQMGDDLRAVALAAGGLNYRTRQVGKQILFEVSAPADRSRRIRFSRQRNNLLAIQYRPQAPSATVAIVGGDGDGASRTIRERPSSAALAAGWPRMEAPFVNSSGTNAEMDQAGDQALAEAAEQAGLSVVAIDTPDQRYGIDFTLGDLVSVDLWPGLAVVDVVTSVTLTATPEDGELVSVQIGTGSSSDPAYVRELRRLIRRTSLFERR
jgi:hypothetical protein